MTEKLQKVLANLGVGSRRDMEAWIKAGRITVNGEIASIGMRVGSHEKLHVDGKPLERRVAKAIKPRALIYNKPPDEVCSRRDPNCKKTVFDRLPFVELGRWVSIGRLDITTTGLLIFTNDGELAHRCMHPSFQVEREYAVRVLGKVDNDMLTRLQKGVRLADGMAKFESILDDGGRGANHWYRVVLREGRNREVRRLWESQGVQVSRLIRIRYGNIRLPRDLPVGQYRELPIKYLQDKQS